MNDSLRIAIADDEPRMRDYLWTSLERLGHQVVVGAKTGRDLIEQCRALHPQLIITDIKMPDMDGLEAVREICREEPIPVILVSAFHDPDYIERATQDHVLAYLVKPIKHEALKPAIAIAMERFRQIQDLRKEAEDWKQALEDRKIIERAKGILMKRAALDESDAFKRLQKLASAKNAKLVEIARMIVTAEEAYDVQKT
jgi:two-component system, response regulator PdtaR